MCLVDLCGIVLAKSNSKRLPNKNFLDLDGKPVWQHAFDALEGVDRYVYGDKFNNRPPGASIDNEPLFSALKWAYKSLPRRYDAIISIMANCPQITQADVTAAVWRFENLGVQELRSFNPDGSESGLMILREDYLLNKHEVSTYQGSIVIKSKEIHTQDDYDYCRNRA